MTNAYGPDCGFGNCIANSKLAIPIYIGRRAATRNPVEALRYE